MVDLPWRGDGADDAETLDEVGPHDDAVVVCEFQDGTIALYEEEVVIERVDRSKFDDKTIPLADVTGVDYARGITVGYVQLELVGVEPDSGGLLSDPINENTLHFGRSGRECAEELRDAILERATGRE